MPYYDTIDEDLKRAKEILDRGKPPLDEILDGIAIAPELATFIHEKAGGAIYGADIYAAYMILRSFVAEIEQMRNTIDTLAQHHMREMHVLEQQLRDVDGLHRALFVEPLIAWAQQQPDGPGIEDGGTSLDWGPLVARIINEHEALRADAERERAARRIVDASLRREYELVEAVGRKVCELALRQQQRMAKDPTGRQSITCPRCGMTSYHPKDVSEKYCGNCHEFHETMPEKAQQQTCEHVWRPDTPHCLKCKMPARSTNA